MKEIKTWVDSKFHRRKARLIAVNDRIPRATVVRSEPRAKVMSSEQKTRLVRIEDSGAEDFIRTAREFLEENSLNFKERPEPKGANQFDLKLLTEHFNLFPVAYLFFRGSDAKWGNHWNLLISKNGSYNSGDTTLTVYDPLSGLKTIPFSRADTLYYHRSPDEWLGWDATLAKQEPKPFTPVATSGSRTRITGVESHPEKKDWAWKLVEQDVYKLEPSRLQHLGGVQNSPDCGIYCVYAAKLAKGK